MPGGRVLTDVESGQLSVTSLNSRGTHRMEPNAQPSPLSYASKRPPRRPPSRYLFGLLLAIAIALASVLVLSFLRRPFECHR